MNNEPYIQVELILTSGEQTSFNVKLKKVPTDEEFILFNDLIRGVSDGVTLESLYLELVSDSKSFVNLNFSQIALSYVTLING